MIADDSVDQDFDPEDCDAGHRGSGHKPLTSVYSIRNSRCGCTDQGSDQRDEEGARKDESVAHGRMPFGSQVNRGGASIPVYEPEQDKDDSERRTDVLKDVAPGSRTEQGNAHLLAKKMPVVVHPVAGMSEGIPQDVRGCPHKDGKGDYSKM